MKKIVSILLLLVTIQSFGQNDFVGDNTMRKLSTSDTTRHGKIAIYLANYGSGFTSRTLVDKGYVDSADALRQALDADLTAIAALSGTNTIYYRSAANTWTAVTIGGNLSFSGGTLNGNAGTVTNFSFSDGNGLVGSVSNATTTPQLSVGFINDASSTEKRVVIHNGTAYQQTAKVVADADYTIAATDYYILLPDPSTTRTLTLGAAGSFKGKHLIIDCRSTSTGEWMLSGSFLQAGTVGTYTEDFVNSGLVAGGIYEIMALEISTGTWKWVQIRPL